MERQEIVSILNEKRKITLNTLDDAYRFVFAAIRTAKEGVGKKRTTPQQNAREEKKEKMQLLINAIEHNNVGELKRLEVKEKRRILEKAKEKDAFLQHLSKQQEEEKEGVREERRQRENRMLECGKVRKRPRREKQ